MNEAQKTFKNFAFGGQSTNLHSPEFTSQAQNYLFHINLKKSDDLFLWFILQGDIEWLFEDKNLDVATLAIISKMSNIIK